jgi:hypothetical protein
LARQVRNGYAIHLRSLRRDKSASVTSCKSNAGEIEAEKKRPSLPKAALSLIQLFAVLRSLPDERAGGRQTEFAAGGGVGRNVPRRFRKHEFPARNSLAICPGLP